MKKGIAVILIVGLVLSLGIAGIVSFYASSEPDGLEKVAEDQGFIDTAQDSANATIPTADYGIEGVESERLSVGLAGVLGVAVMALVAFGLFWLLTRGKKSADSDTAARP
jgi:hypothetical protein